MVGWVIKTLKNTTVKEYEGYEETFLEREKK